MIRKVLSFGYKHGEPLGQPGGVPIVLLDVRHFMNPHVRIDLRHRNGLDPQVQGFIQRTAEFQKKSMALYDRAAQLDLQPGPVILALGCLGGKHRSVYFADWIGRCFGAPVEHRDINKGLTGATTS